MSIPAVAFLDLVILRNTGVNIKFVSQETIQDKKVFLEGHSSTTLLAANT